MTERLTPSEWWQRFERSFFTHRAESGRDGPDLEAVARLGGDERRRAEQRLLEALDRRPDSWIIGALGVLRSSSAAARLRALATTAAGAEGPVPVAIAEALWRIDGEPGAVKTIDAALEWMRHGVWKLARVDAVHALGSIGTEEAMASLRRLLDDPDPLVRYNALVVLGHMHGQLEGDLDLRGILQDDPESRSGAIRSFEEKASAWVARWGPPRPLE